MNQPDASAVPSLVDHLFRENAGYLVARLTRIFGSRYIDDAEDVVQEVMMRALKSWPYSGVPDNPTAWMVRVAKNRALDLVRHHQVFRHKQDLFAATLAEWHESEADATDSAFAHEVRDEQLRMMFMCCHPEIPSEGRMALTLKMVGGFSSGEIARAFLSSEPTVAQRIVRAKRKIRGLALPFEMPPSTALPERIDSVMRVLYLMFNEGHSAHEGKQHVRADLCRNALRLVRILAEHPLTASGEVFALTAYFHFQAARLPARCDRNGQPVLLAHQNRALWDQQMIGQGVVWMARSALGDRLTAYHLKAEIASCHALAARAEETDWPRILHLYDLLLNVSGDAVVALNRVVALAEVESAPVALKALTELAGEPRLENYLPYHATRAELHARCGESEAARQAYRRALTLAMSEPVSRYFRARLDEFTDDE
ncbi:RNA polymerase sigma factor [Acanthopleuribacter pedis]|uniref:Sigma-70 family RNA polymerase sigma factor n=1 Tax=Acanthopleuribacter pedis TaxID=442870 RepID=A0A8J7Q0X1_9BACT|nr:sigma-70 family RNA polymerase sigma factor [Acanthopleuribacter pedis]MBO1317190.1 sigma-70 family RNA polymerase sigma factor [Acanthopleuribacter pedis]